MTMCYNNTEISKKISLNNNMGKPGKVITKIMSTANLWEK